MPTSRHTGILHPSHVMSAGQARASSPCPCHGDAYCDVVASMPYDLRQELARALILSGRKEFSRGGFLAHLAGIHENNAICHFACEAHLMSDTYHCPS